MPFFFLLEASHGTRSSFLLHHRLDHQPSDCPRAGALNMAFDPAHDQVVQSNPLLVRLFSALSMNRACDLHQRLQAGRTDPETRQLLRQALALSKQEQAAN